MKILLLTLVLGLVCAAQEPQPDIDYSLFSGEWKTIYAASSNIEKISENGPWRAFVRRLDFDSEGNTICFTFFVKVDGQCTKMNTVATKAKENVYVCSSSVRSNGDVAEKIIYAGKTIFQILQFSENAIIVCFVNEDEEGLITEIIALFGRENDNNEEDIEKFKELTREKGIPEENTLNIINIDDCPTID